MTNPNETVETPKPPKTTAQEYYETKKAEGFDLFDAEMESPAPGQVIFNSKSNAWRTPKNCKEHGLDFELFVTWFHNYRDYNDLG